MKQYLKDLISESCDWKSLSNSDKFQYKFNEDSSQLFCICDYCGEYFEILEIRSRKITNEKHYHSSCYRKTEEYAEMRRNAMKKNKGEGKCSVCGKWNKHRDQNQRGKDGLENKGCNCSGEFYKKHNSSEKMVQLSISKLEELNKDPDRLKDLQYGKEQKCKHGNIFRAHTEEELKSKCEASCYCRNCNILLSKDKLGCLCDKCYYKATANNGFIRSFIEENNCEIHKGMCNVSYHIGNKEYLCWECYKEKFQINSESLPMDGYDFIDIPTFRTQDSDDWTGARNAFESYLVENNITWFIYIKYYIDAYAASRPLVVGKTGSRLVNKAGTDVSFSTDITDGPARIFLYENNLTWYKTKISIIKCNSEKEALEIEKEISEKFGLFSS